MKNKGLSATQIEMICFKTLQNPSFLDIQFSQNMN